MVGNERLTKISTCLMGIILLSIVLATTPAEVKAHAPEDMELRYDYFTQTLNVSISHTGYQDQHYIQTIEIFKNNISIIEETYTEQDDLRDLYYTFEVFGEDGDVLKAVATSSGTGQGQMEKEVTVIGPKDRMEISVNEIDEIEMGEEWDFTINIDQEGNGDPLDGVNVRVTAWLGELSEVSPLGIGGYSVTYTAPELEDQDLEVINITASRNGYHTAYYEFDIDVIFPVDDSRKIVVTLSPEFSTIDEGQTKEITATVTVKEGNAALDIDDIHVERSGGVVSHESTGTGVFLITFKANEVSTDVDGWIKVTAEKEGYAKGTAQMTFKIKDTGAPIDDDDDDGVSVGNDSGLFSTTNIIIIVVVLAIIGGVVGFFIYRSRKK